MNRTTFVNGLAGLTLVFSASAHAADSSGTMVGGFVDGQIMYTSKDTAGTATGFFLTDGAIYVSKSMKGSSAKIDVPYVDWITTGFSLPGKTQAYMEHSYSNGVSWKLGKFDRYFGFEGVDSVDQFFTSDSTLNGSLPVTHLGLMPMYEVNDDFNVGVLVANPNDTMTLGGNTPDLGVIAKMTMGDAHLGVGGLLHDKDLASDYMIEFMAGTKMGDLDLDAQFDLSSSGSGTSSWGLLGQGIYHVNSNDAAGARVEYLSDMGADKELHAAIGWNCKVSSSITSKLDYMFGSVTAVSGGTAVTSHAAALSGVYSF